MDYTHLTAPCGLDCFNCAFFLVDIDEEASKQVKKWSNELQIPLEIMKCRGCRSHDGQIPLQ